MKNYFNKNFMISNHKISYYLSRDTNAKKFYSWFSNFTEEIEILGMSPPGNNNDNNSWLHIFTAATTFYFLTNKGNSNNRK